MIKPLYLIDRNNKEYKIFPARLNVLRSIGKFIPRVNSLLNLYKPLDQKEYALDEQIHALQELIRSALKSSNSPSSLTGFDIWMGKQAVNYFIGYGNNKTIRRISGTLIQDRFGKDHVVYSYLLNNCKQAMDLLSKIDSQNIAANFDDASRKYAMLTMTHAALNGNEDRETIETYLDVEFFRKILSIYYDTDTLTLEQDISIIP